MDQPHIVDIADAASFASLPPCADPRFDHRTCDHWEDADRGSKAARPSWLTPGQAPLRPSGRPSLAGNPFAPAPRTMDDNPFLTAEEDDSTEAFEAAVVNPFAPLTSRPRPLREGVPRKLALLDRGRGVFGSYAKVLLLDGTPLAYCQFGPLSAYPRAGRLRDLYPMLPDSPLPAVITCVATTGDARRMGYGRVLVADVCRDLGQRGFSAVEAYPDLTLPEDESSAGSPIFWHACGFLTAVDDERFPVMRRELD